MWLYYILSLIAVVARVHFSEAGAAEVTKVFHSIIVANRLESLQYLLMRHSREAVAEACLDRIAMSSTQKAVKRRKELFERPTIRLMLMAYGFPPDLAPDCTYDNSHTYDKRCDAVVATCIDKYPERMRGILGIFARNHMYGFIILEKLAKFDAPLFSELVTAIPEARHHHLAVKSIGKNLVTFLDSDRDFSTYECHKEIQELKEMQKLGYMNVFGYLGDISVDDLNIPHCHDDFSVENLAHKLSVDVAPLGIVKTKEDMTQFVEAYDIGRNWSREGQNLDIAAKIVLQQMPEKYQALAGLYGNINDLTNIDPVAGQKLIENTKKSARDLRQFHDQVNSNYVDDLKGRSDLFRQIRCGSPYVKNSTPQNLGGGI